MNNNSKTLECNSKRLMADFDNLKGFTDTPNQGVTRFSYSPQDRSARDYLIKEFKKLELDILIDPIGNIIATYNQVTSPSLPSILIGSHIDTVFQGGGFDGMLGVLLPLEALRTIHESNTLLNRPVSIIIFAEEEGSNFNTALLGSRYIIGEINRQSLESMHNNEGTKAYNVIKNAGYDVKAINNLSFHCENYYCMIEPHIEQASYLDANNINLGIISSIVGEYTYFVDVTGVANHAGATPMDLRKDALCAASEIVLDIESISKSFDGHTVGTVGEIHCSPNSKSAIPGHVRFTIDLRSSSESNLENLNNLVLDSINTIAKKRDVLIKTKFVAKTPVVHLNEEILEKMKSTAQENRINYCVMSSGAIHDAVKMSSILPTAMFFLPSVDGRSHCPEEYTREEDIQIGCNFLLRLIQNI